MYKVMIEIDIKDKKILYYLDIDSRQSLTQIGKKVGLPKNVVSYRIKRLKKIGVINNFYTIMDLHKLGYSILRFYFTYQYATPEIKQEIIDYFLKCKYAGIIHTVEGSYDLVVYMYLKNLNEFYDFWEQTLAKYRDYFATQTLSHFYQENMYNNQFLINEQKPRKRVDVHKGKSITQLDELDLKILTMLAPNARIPTKEIAKRLGVTTITIANRIKKLIEKEVIQWFRTSIDFTKLGYQWYKVDIILKDQKKLSQIVNYLSNNPNFIAVDKTLGYVDLELEFYLHNISEIHKIMEDLSIKFPNSIRQYAYVYVVKTHRYDYFPKLM
jgi:DNA-binding Lrp family transcriptional regulator